MARHLRLGPDEAAAVVLVAIIALLLRPVSAATTGTCNADGDFLPCSNTGNTAEDMGYRLRGTYKINDWSEIPPALQDSTFSKLHFTDGSSTIVRLDLELRVPFSMAPDQLFDQLYCRVRSNNWILAGSGSGHPQCGFDACESDDQAQCLSFSAPLNFELVFDRARFFLPLQKYDQSFPFDYMVFKRQTQYSNPYGGINKPRRGCMTDKAPAQAGAPPNSISYESCDCTTAELNDCTSLGSCSSCCYYTRTRGTCTNADNGADAANQQFQYAYPFHYCLVNAGNGNGLDFHTYQCIDATNPASQGCPPCASPGSTPDPNKYPDNQVFPARWTEEAGGDPLTPLQVYEGLYQSAQTGQPPTRCMAFNRGSCELYNVDPSFLDTTWADSQVSLCQAPPPINLSGMPSNGPGAPASSSKATRLDPALFEELTDATTAPWRVPIEGNDAAQPRTGGGTYSLQYAGLQCGFCYQQDSNCQNGLSLASQLFLMWGVGPVCYASQIDADNAGVAFDLSFSVSKPGNVLNKTLSYFSSPYGQAPQYVAIDAASSQYYAGGYLQFEKTPGQDGFFSNDISADFADLYGTVYCTDAYGGLQAEQHWNYTADNPASTSSKYLPIPGIPYRAFPFAQMSGRAKNDLCEGCTPLEQKKATTDPRRLWYTLNTATYQQMVGSGANQQCTGKAGEPGRLAIGTDWFSQAVGGAFDPDAEALPPMVEACLSMPGHAASPQLCRPTNTGGSFASPCGSATSFQQWSTALPDVLDQQGDQTIRQSWLNYQAASMLSSQFDNTVSPTVWLESAPAQGLFSMYPPFTGASQADNPYTPQIILASVYVNLTSYGIKLDAPATLYSLQVVSLPSDTANNNLCPLVGKQVQCTNANTAAAQAACGKAQMAITIQSSTPATAQYMLDVSDCVSKGMPVASNQYTGGSAFSLSSSLTTTIQMFFGSTSSSAVTADTTCKVLLKQINGLLRPIVYTFEPWTCATTSVQSPSPSATPSHSLSASKNWDGSVTPSHTPNPSATSVPLNTPPGDTSPSNPSSRNFWLNSPYAAYAIAGTAVLLVLGCIVLCVVVSCCRKKPDAPHRSHQEELQDYDAAKSKTQ